MSITSRMTLALVLGAALGLVIELAPGLGLAPVIGVLEPVGTMWVNAIRMTIVPLVFSLVVGSLASAGDTRAVGRLGARSVGAFVVLLVGAGLFAILVGIPLVQRIPMDPAALAALRAAAAGSAAAAEGVRKMPSAAQVITDMVPTNPVKAAADGAMLPLVVFAAALGMALLRVAPERRSAVVALMRGVSDALMVLVAWIIRVGPVGVFALSAVMVARTGGSAAGAFALYVASLTGALLAFWVMLLLVTAAVGRTPLPRLLRALAPALAIGFGSRSSMAALPAAMTAARDRLGLPPAVTDLTMPLAAAIFRLTTPLAWVMIVLFMARLYGVELGAGAVLYIVAVSIPLSFSVPGIPSASLLMMAPFLAAFGIPTEGIGILIAVDALPDIAKTLVNATSFVSAATIVARGERVAVPNAAPAEAA